MKKKIVSLVLTGAMVAAMLSGCGSSTATTTESMAAPESEATTTETTEIATEATTEAAGDLPACAGALEGVSFIVGTSGTYGPFSYFAEDGTTLQGFDIDMLYALQDILKFDIADEKIQDMDYGPLTTSVTQGQLDIAAAALCATDERKKNMNFTDTYYDAGIMVIVAEDNEEITSVDDLKSGDYKVAIQSGTIAYTYADENLPAECLQVFDSQALAYKAVEDGQADATIYDKPGTAYSISTGEIQLKMVGDEFFTGQAPYAVALSFDACEANPNLVEVFNEAIAYLQENGTMDTIENKWCE